MKVRTIFTLLLTGLFIGARAQKGDKSIAVGPLVSFPVATESLQNDLKPGIGLEAIGEYYVSDRSALLLKTTLTSWKYKDGPIAYGIKRLKFLTFQGGYKFQFSNPFFL